MCFYSDDGYAEFYREKEVKARKEHKCYECCKTVLKNEIYQYIFTVFEGNVSVIKICSKCKNIRQRIHDIEINHGCSENESWVPFGGLREYAKDYGLEVGLNI